jgi:hypothetical protein
MPAELDTGPLSFIRSNTVDHHVPSDLAVAERKRVGVHRRRPAQPGSVDLILYDNLDRTRVVHCRRHCWPGIR